MSDQYEKPTVTLVGNLFDLAGRGCAPAQATYQLQEYVWATGNPDGSGTRWLARIESKHSVRSASGRRWLVRVRKQRFWTSGAMHMYVIRALTGEEFAHNRKLGLIPAAGERI